MRRIIKAGIAGLLGVALALSGCSSKPNSRREATAALKKTLLVKADYLSTTEEKGGATYHYRDENGLEFSVFSRAWGSPLPSYTLRSDYADRWLATFRDEIDDLMEGLEWTWPHYAFGSTTKLSIMLRDYDDVAPAAAAVSGLLDVGIVPLRDGGLSPLPEIHVRVMTTDGKDLSLFHESVPREGRTPTAPDVIARTIDYYYLTRVAAGVIDDEVDPAILAALPPHTLALIHDGQTIGQARYDIAIQRHIVALDFCQTEDTATMAPTPARSRNRYYVTDFVIGLGGSYRASDRHATWTIGRHTWSATVPERPGNIGTVLDWPEVTRDGAPLTVRSEALLERPTVSRQYFVFADVEQFFGVTVRIDETSQIDEVGWGSATVSSAD
ncbi:MAG: hypothetical protein LBM23_02150 [Propionibacteriaceae bacterium]|jgi:hypothetical protein|nr:hypothetical protein [Propionibacteriaceae bacterium]